MNENIKPLQEKSLEVRKVIELKKILDEKVLKDHKLNIEINRFGHYLENKYPSDCFDYRLFRLIVGSTPPEGSCSKFDFEGGDSVEKFIKSL